METKRCGKCHHWFPFKDFSKQAKSRDGFQNYCRKCAKAHKAKDRYGITLQDIEALKALQGNLCAICALVFNGQVRPVVDHCHAYGHVRGLLCNACNIVLGMSRDSVEILQGAIRYLEKRSKR